MTDSYTRHKLDSVISIAKLVTVFYWDYEKTYVFSGESHDFWEMVYVDRGDVVVTAGKREFPLQQGEMYFHKPNEFHKIRANGQSAANVLILSFVCHSPSMSFFRIRKVKLADGLMGFISHIITESRSAFLLPCFDENIDQLEINENAPIGAQQLVRIYLELLLIQLLRDESQPATAPLVFSAKESFDNHLVEQIIHLMDKNIYGNLSIKEICNTVNYGKTFASNTFKNTTGYSIMQYYNTLKIAEAKMMIREGGVNFTQISNRLCFDNPHYFTRVFKRVTGMTPKEYQLSVNALPE